MMEFSAAITVLFCSITYWLGGQEIPWTKRGYKWIRRFVLPAGLCISLIFFGSVVWYRALLACSLLSAALHLGYQDKWYKFAFTGLLYGAPAWILCWPKWNWMIGLPFTYHLAYGLISLKFNRFKWAFVGILVGVGIGIAYITAATMT